MNSTKGWSEEDHFNFYESLKPLSTEHRSKALINQARELLQSAQNQDHDLLKAAESIMTYWTLNNRVETDEREAHRLLYQIYMAMGEPDRAKAFGE